MNWTGSKWRDWFWNRLVCLIVRHDWDNWYERGRLSLWIERTCERCGKTEARMGRRRAMTETRRTVSEIRLYSGRLEKMLAEAEADRDVKALHAMLAVLGSFARTDMPRLLDAVWDLYGMIAHLYHEFPPADMADSAREECERMIDEYAHLGTAELSPAADSPDGEKEGEG